MGGEGRLSLQPNFQKGGGLTELLEGVAGKEEGDFFQGGGRNCHIKAKLKSEIFNDKKSL